ncbi:MAG: hypothetical protein NT118_15515, partial [Lentisphaerae bacterium]|nr:hypothetical protein [Lentisphaerota bacterium]
TKREVNLLVRAETSKTLDPPVKPGMILGKLTALERRGKKIGVGSLRGSFWQNFTDFGTVSPGKRILQILMIFLPFKSPRPKTIKKK